MPINLVTKYDCPYCPQTSSRKGNLEIHIKRKHGMELSHVENQSGRVSTGQGIHLDKACYIRPLFRSPYHHDTFAQRWNYNMSTQNHEPRDVIRDVLQWIKPYAELKSVIESMFGSNKSSNPILASPIGLIDQLAVPYPIPDIGGLFGFRTRLCYRCLINTIVVVRFEHEVDGHNCAHINGSWAIRDKSEIIKKLSDNAPNLLYHTVSNFQNPSYNLLHAVSLSGDSLANREIIIPNRLNSEQTISILSENETKIDLDLDRILHEGCGRISNYWFKNLIEEGWAELSNVDLLSYLHLVKTATFAFFLINTKTRSRHILSIWNGADLLYREII